MPPPAGSEPVYLQIAQALRERSAGWIAGEWPTVRIIAHEFNVSPVTASRAIQALKNEARVPEPRPAAVQERWAVGLHVSPGPYRHAAYQVTAAGFHALAQRGHGHFDLETVRLDDDPTDGRIRERVRTAASETRGLFLLPSRLDAVRAQRDEAILTAAAAEHLPVILLERNLRGLNRPLARDLVCVHDFEGGATLTRHLLDQGRTRIAFVTASETSSHAERLGGYLATVLAAGVEPLVIEQLGGATPRQAYTAMVDQLAAARADGVICYHDYAAIATVVELLRRGVRVPAQVAVAGFYNMPIGESFSIGITTYACPAITVAERAVDLMRWRLANPGAAPLKLVVPGSLIVRDSTDPAAGG